MNEPSVTVLMPVYNGERYLREAIDSILNQTFIDFEFLIVNDGSTDRSVAIIESYNDPRIRLVHNKQNVGLVDTLNSGLDIARGTYIARMDCDDIALPKRLEKQVDYMEKHPAVGICGAWIKIIGDAPAVVWSYPTGADEIKCRLLFESVLPHPTVVFRRKVIVGSGLRYDPSFRFSEDYDLWVRASREIQLANIGEVLLHYRAHENNVGVIHKTDQSNNVALLQMRQLEELAITPSPEEFETHQGISRWQFISDRTYVERVEKWLLKLKHANDTRHIFPEPAFSRELAGRWFAACNAAAGIGRWTLRTFGRSHLRYGISLSIPLLLFVLKCMLKASPPHE